MMGDNGNKPIHKVTLSTFKMSKYLITQKLFHLVMGNRCQSFYPVGHANRPVIVLWDDAVSFCEKFSRIVGQVVKLPSESQWEYACRAGSTGKYSFGDNDDLLRYYGWSGHADQPIAGKLPNAWGLYDMHGNGCEWCEDVFHEDYNRAPNDGTAWLKGGEQDKRIARGWSDGSSVRHGLDTDTGAGIRIVIA